MEKEPRAPAPNPVGPGPGRGADPVALDRAAAVVRDQIEAHKTVQHALHARWTALPGQPPAEEPDLGEVRPESADRDARERGSDRAVPDTLRTVALARPLVSVCD